MPTHTAAAGGVSLLVACNLPLLDASTHLAPSAGPGTGRFEVVCAPGGMARGAALALLSSVSSGAHAASAAVSTTPAAAVVFRPLCGGASAALALDGERVGGGSKGGGRERGPAVAVAMECVPGAARLVVA